MIHQLIIVFFFIIYLLYNFERFRRKVVNYLMDITLISEVIVNNDFSIDFKNRLQFLF